LKVFLSSGVYAGTFLHETRTSKFVAKRVGNGVHLLIILGVKILSAQVAWILSV
jgi:hypothetical protein